MHKKAQAGLEYLITYGWALVIIATIVGVLVFVVSSPVNQPAFTSSDPSKLLLKGGSISADTATIKLQNITGGEIKSLALSGSGGYSDCEPTTGQEPIASGGDLTIVCDIAPGATQGTIAITFTDRQGLEHRVTVSAKGPPAPVPAENPQSFIVEEILDGGNPGGTFIMGDFYPNPNSVNDWINTKTNFDFTAGCGGGSCVGHTVSFADGAFSGQQFNIMAVKASGDCWAFGLYNPENHSCARLQPFNAVDCTTIADCISKMALPTPWHFTISQ